MMAVTRQVSIDQVPRSYVIPPQQFNEEPVSFPKLCTVPQLHKFNKHKFLVVDMFILQLGEITFYGEWFFFFFFSFSFEVGSE